jgi:predicted phage terminase large subunit-like protein
MAMKNTRYGRYVLDSQFRQKPTALGGNLIPVDKFKRYRLADIAGARWDDINITVDTAMKKGQENDYSAAQAWGKLDGEVYLLARIHGKWESPELLTQVAQFTVRVRLDYEGVPVRCKVEAKAAGIGLVQQMHALQIPAEEIERDIDKVRRVKTVMPFIEQGFVYLPDADECPWVEDVINECASFSETLSHANDDDVDCLVDGIQLHLGGGRGILDLYG